MTHPDPADLRAAVPQVLSALVRRGAEFAAAEDAVQDALVEGLRTWAADPAAGRPRLAGHGRVAAVPGRRPLGRRPPAPGVPAAGGTRRGARTGRLAAAVLPLRAPVADPSSAVALTLRAVGGLTTRQIAEAYLVPEATMAQRISRAKRTVAGERLDAPGDVGTVLRTLYLVFNEGYGGDVDLVAEAVRLTRQLHQAFDHPEVAGLLALMLLHAARRRPGSRRTGRWCRSRSRTGGCGTRG